MHKKLYLAGFKTLLWSDMDFLVVKKAIGIGIFLAFMLGPVFFMLIQTSILKGFRAAFAFDLGVILADVIFLFAAFHGSKSFISEVKDNPWLYYAGGLIMIIYGIVMFVRKTKEVILDDKLVVTNTSRYSTLFINGFLLNFINVGVLGFWVGMIVVFGAEFDMDGNKVFNFFAIVVLSYLATDIGKILLAKKLRQKMTPAITYKMKRGMGILLVLFGISLILKGLYF